MHVAERVEADGANRIIKVNIVLLVVVNATGYLLIAVVASDGNTASALVYYVAAHSVATHDAFVVLPCMSSPPPFPQTVNL